MRRKPRKWILWVAPSIVHAALLLGLSAGFRYLEPLQGTTEALVCEPDEHLVFERTITHDVQSGTSGYTDQSCCAKVDDPRTHGRCNSGSSFRDVDDLLVMLVPLGISLGVATIVAGVLLLILILRYRAVYRWARAQAARRPEHLRGAG